MALTLVRHTPPSVGVEICYGALDVELAADCADAAAALAARFAPVDRIVTSPLRRCRLLAEALGSRLAVPVALDADWREMDFGRWQGRRWADIPRAELDAWAADFMHARPHGGESVAMLVARTREAIGRCCPERRWLAVTHSGVIRAALFAAGAQDAWTRSIGFGSVVELAEG
jgi:alpha-ribazole phosphatase